MKKEELIEAMPEVFVSASTYGPIGVPASMIGHVCTLMGIRDDGLAAVFQPDMKDYWLFNLEDLELMK